MLRVVTTELDHPPVRVYPVLADLASYAAWMPLVHRVEADGADEAWLVTLRARVGPLARAKRLRMVRTAATAPRHVRFERAETDGRSHSAWIMDGVVTELEDPARCGVRIELRYEGGLWSAALDALLGSSIDDAVDGLRRQVERA